MQITATALALHLGCKFEGDGAVLLTGFASAELARPGDLTFAPIIGRRNCHHFLDQS